MALLEMKNVHSYYGHIHALKGVSLTVNEGEIVTLIGSNGAGKSTTLRTASGMMRPRKGEVWLKGERIDTSSAETIVKRGLAHVPEGRRIFPRLSVLENLEMGGYIHSPSSPEYRAALERIFGLFPRLYERLEQKGGTLSGGEQQMLAVGRALMTNPRLLILDEATEGLAPVIRAEIWHVVERLKREGQSILLIDKTFSVLKRIADRHFILEKGITVWTGTGDDLTRDHARVQAWVGV